MTRKKITRVSLIVACASLQGCGLSTFTQRENDPYILDWFTNLVKDNQVTVTDSSRRLIFEIDRGNDLPTIICADPPPDTSIATAGSVTTKVTSTGPEGKGSVGVEGGRTSSTSTMPLIKRSQGLQWERDNMARECLLFALKVSLEKKKGEPDKNKNEYTKYQNEYINRIDEIRDKAYKLIEKEIEKGIGEFKLVVNPSPGAGQAAAGGGDKDEKEEEK